MGEQKSGRRRFLGKVVGGLTGVGLTVGGGMYFLSGGADLTSEPSASFTYSPKRPVVGESVVFDGADSENAERIRWNFEGEGGNARWGKDPEEWERTSVRTSWEFSSSGFHPVKMVAVGGRGPAKVDSVVKRIPVAESNSDITTGSLDVKEESINMLLRATQTSLDLSAATTIEFSVSNLLAERDVLVQLLVEVPSSLNVTGVSSMRTGIGQYSMRDTVQPGQTTGATVTLSPTRSGEFDIPAAVVYKPAGSSDSSFKSTVLPVLVR